MDRGPDRADVIVTAGAYVLVDGLLAFVVGAKPNGNRLAIVRLGGYREQDETGWECAAREVHEEASLEIRPMVPPATYWLAPPHDAVAMERCPTLAAPDDPVAPVFIAWRLEEGVRKLSVMYLAIAQGVPVPSNEVRALILL
ncbi:MAG TPA: NUDIX domain-containing protein, partial [Chloroflexota bacterium]|nr:NUDIX domain-containing protein [Chloroflexota bacterium]